MPNRTRQREFWRDISKPTLLYIALPHSAVVGFANQPSSLFYRSGDGLENKIVGHSGVALFVGGTNTSRALLTHT